MKKLLKTSVFVAGLMMSTSLLAHPGHDEVVQLTQETAIEAAGAKLVELVDSGELATGWSKLTPTGAQVARINGRQNWIVSYRDETAQQRLELVFSMTGEYVSMAKTIMANTASN